MWSCLYGILWEWCLLLKPGSFTGKEFNFESQMIEIFEMKSDFIRVRMLKTATIWNWHDKNIKTWILGAFGLSTLATGELKYWKVYWAHSYKSYIQGLNSRADALFEAIWISSKNILDYRIYLVVIFKDWLSIDFGINVFSGFHLLHSAADGDTVCWELNEKGLGDRVFKIINWQPILFNQFWWLLIFGKNRPWHPFKNLA